MHKIAFVKLDSPINGRPAIRGLLRYNQKDSNIIIQLLPRPMFEMSQINTTLTLPEFNALNQEQVNEIFVKFLGKDIASGIKALLK